MLALVALAIGVVPGARIVVTIHGNPALQLLQRPKQSAAIHNQIADNGKLAHWPQLNLARLIRQQLINSKRSKPLAAHDR